MMDERYCNPEVSTLLKKLGFDERCRAFWKDWNGKVELYHADRGQMFDYCYNTMLEKEYTWEDEKNIAAPTLAMAREWIWKKYGFYVNAIYGDYPALKKSFWMPQIDSLDGCYGVDDEDFFKEYDSPDECLEAALLYLIKNKLTVNG